jgi:hypothetical protein
VIDNDTHDTIDTMFNDTGGSDTSRVIRDTRLIQNSDFKGNLVFKKIDFKGLREDFKGFNKIPSQSTKIKSKVGVAKVKVLAPDQDLSNVQPIKDGVHVQVQESTVPAVYNVLMQANEDPGEPDGAVTEANEDPGEPGGGVPEAKFLSRGANHLGRQERGVEF